MRFYVVMMWWDMMRSGVMRCDVMRCNVMWFDVMWCDVMSLDVMKCDVTLVYCRAVFCSSYAQLASWQGESDIGFVGLNWHPKATGKQILPFFYEGNCSGLFLPPDSSTKPSYLVPVIVVAVVALVCVAVLLAFKLRVGRQRNGRMKLTEKHADTLPHPYPEEKTFENPIYQVSKKRGVCNLNAKENN